MARLRIGVEQLGAKGLRLELDSRSGTPNVIAFAPGGGVHGSYEQDESYVGLHDLRAQTLVLSEFTWEVLGGRVHGRGRLHNVEIEAKLATHAHAQGTAPFYGTLRAGRLELTADLKLEGISLHAAEIEVDDFELTAGEDGRMVARIGRATARGARAHGETFEIELSDLALPRGALFDGENTHIEALELGALGVRLTDLARFSAPTNEPGASSKSLSFLGDDQQQLVAEALGHVHGQINVDVHTDLTVPILGNHRSTHCFRVPVESGQIDFTVLESGLSKLAELVLDFELKGDRLILEKDLPLVPFDNQTLVEWPLDAHGIALAKQKRISIADLLSPGFPQSARREAKKDAATGKGFDIRCLEVRGLDIQLATSVPFVCRWAGGQVQIGDHDRPPFAALQLGGELTYRANSQEPGRVELEVEDICVCGVNFVLGEYRLHLTRGTMDNLQKLQIRFDGLSPTELHAEFRELKATKIRLEK